MTSNWVATDGEEFRVRRTSPNKKNKTLEDHILLEPYVFSDESCIKVVNFVPCDIDSLPTLTIPSAKQRRMQYVRTVLDQKPNTDSVKVEKLEAIDGLPDCRH